MKKVKYLFLVSLLTFSVVNADTIGIGGILDKISSYVDRLDQDRVKFDNLMEKMGFKPKSEEVKEDVNDVNID